MKKENIFDLYAAQHKDDPAPAADRVPGEVTSEDVAPPQEVKPAPDPKPETKQEPAPEETPAPDGAPAATPEEGQQDGI